MSGQVVTIRQGDFVTSGIFPYILESDVNVVKPVVDGHVHYVPFSSKVLRTMLKHRTIIVADGEHRTIEEAPIQEHAPTSHKVNLPPITVANDLVSCGGECQKVEVMAGDVVDCLFLDHSSLRYCRKRETGEAYVFAYLTRDAQDRAEAIYNDIVFRGSMEADVEIALERFSVANDQPLFHGENECDSCHHFFGVHSPGCANGGAAAGAPGPQK